MTYDYQRERSNRQRRSHVERLAAIFVVIVIFNVLIAYPIHELARAAGTHWGWGRSLAVSGWVFATAYLLHLLIDLLDFLRDTK